ncbi:MAG: hypothetical protein L7G90_03335 [Candidatus Nanopusillus sp.]|nr:hypothetical protein [Candidatus Nanopusillus sp.]
MDKGLEFVIKVYKEHLNLSKEQIERIKEDISYLEYIITDAIINYPNKKIDILSLIIYFSYLFGNIIEDDGLLMLFITTLLGIYNGKKLAKYES